MGIARAQPHGHDRDIQRAGQSEAPENAAAGSRDKGRRPQRRSSSKNGVHVAAAGEREDPRARGRLRKGESIDARMGSERSRDRRGYSLPAMQVAAHPIPAADPEVYHARNREQSFRHENFPEGILLSGLPLHLGKGRRSAPTAGGLGNVLLARATRGKLQIPSSKLQRSSKFQTSKRR